MKINFLTLSAIYLVVRELKSENPGDLIISNAFPKNTPRIQPAKPLNIINTPFPNDFLYNQIICSLDSHNKFSIKNISRLFHFKIINSIPTKNKLLT